MAVNGDEITAVIEQAVAEAKGEEVPAAETTTTETPESTTETVVEAAAAETASETKVETPAQTDEIEALLKAEGVEAPVEGRRENRLPYPRVKKIVENALKRAKGDTEKAIAEATKTLKSENEAARKRLQNMDNVDKLIAEDPDKYIGMLATLHPDKYKRFLTPQPEVKPEVKAADDPRPQPDVKFQDGSLGYSPEQYQKLEGWQIREAKRQAGDEFRAEIKKLEEKYEQKYGPIEKAFTTSQARARNIQTVQTKIATASKRWGTLFTEDYNKADAGKSEILKKMQENDGKEGRPYLSFEECVEEVLIPKLTADRTKLRAEFMEEMNSRPAAAKRTTTTGTPKAAAKPDDNESMDDVIRRAIDESGIRGR